LAAWHLQHGPSSNTQGAPFHAWHLQDFNNTGPEATHRGNHSLPDISRTSTTLASKRHTAAEYVQHGPLSDILREPLSVCLASPGLQQYGPSSDARGEPLPAWHLQDFNNTGPQETRGGPFHAYYIQGFNNMGPRATYGGYHPLPGISRTSTTRALKRHTGGTIASLASPGLQQRGPTSDTWGEPLPAWHSQDFKTGVAQLIY
jgi:hypothetical protein